jgi:hypothetical protein
VSGKTIEKQIKTRNISPHYLEAPTRNKSNTLNKIRKRRGEVKTLRWAKIAGAINK